MNSTITRYGLVLCFCGLLIPLNSVPLWAQWASLEGTVTDATAAAVPGAIVTALNVRTGVSYQFVTTGAGKYPCSPNCPRAFIP